jgi:hypothetical protein
MCERQIEYAERGASAQLAAVVQSRLWAMMQRRLFDCTDPPKIWKKFTLHDIPAEEDEFPDLLGTLAERDRLGDGIPTRLDDFEEDEIDEFEDLLSRDDDALFEYMEQQEILSVERETEEMLFRAGWDGNWMDGEDEYLLDGGDGGDLMLL